MNNSRNTFKYSNKTYSLDIDLYTSTGNEKTDLKVALDLNDTELFDYSTKLNSLLVEGKIVYLDQYAQVDKLMSQHVCYCYVNFAELKNPQQRENGIGKPDETKMFCHTFIVTNIKPLDRQQSKVKYEIDLVSINWFNCIANVQYTNYDKGPEQIFTIFKNCLTSSGLKVDDESFSRTQANVSINFISKLNDNMFSVADFLMKRLYHMPQKDTSVKFFFYDLFAQKYKLLDLRDKDSFIGTYPTTISMFKSGNETMIQQDPTNIGAFADPIAKTQVYSTLFDKRICGYSYEKNDFITTEFSSVESRQYMNNKLENNNYELKYYDIPQFSNLKFYQTGSYWNNTIDFYNDSIAMLEENGALILNITGDILRQVGTYTLINLDRSLANVANDSKKELEREKYKYKNFEGIWCNSKVQNIINPKKAEYRQKVVLFRNFIPKLRATI